MMKTNTYGVMQGPVTHSPGQQIQHQNSFGAGQPRDGSGAAVMQ